MNVSEADRPLLPPSHETAIANLLYTYAELIDAGDFEAVAELLSDAELIVDSSPGSERVIGREAIGEMFRSSLRVYDDSDGGPAGPRTRHVISNPIIDFDNLDPSGEPVSATCRSIYVVLQWQRPAKLVTLLSGRYRDRFTRIGDRWRFTERDYTMMDLVGDLSAHLS